MRLRLSVLAIVTLFAAPSHATTIDLFTMGRGDDLFSAFGHAAICVHDARSPEGRCYNYGTADFRTPLPLTINFVRGRALFWVSVLDEPRMLAFYAEEGRAVWRQRLPLPPAELDALAAALEASTDERAKYYRYHHFNDNCTTRIRDLVDRVTGGALKANVVDRGRSFRDWARDGFAGNTPLLMAVELLLGHPSDRHTDSWTAMFLPSELRAEVARRLHAEPELILRGRFGPLDGSVWLGRLAFVLVGALLALLLVGGARLGRRGLVAALALTGFVIGLVAVVLDVLALASSFPELTRNEALLIFWPTDLLLPFLKESQLRRYVEVRLLALAVVVLLHLGWFSQPLAPLLTCALPLGTVALLTRARKISG